MDPINQDGCFSRGSGDHGIRGFNRRTPGRPARRYPAPMQAPGPTTYWEYVRIEELLGLQKGLEDSEARLENDEVLFITVHQVFELWFKLVLRELKSARDLFCANPCLLYTSPSPRDQRGSRMPSSA